MEGSSHVIYLVMDIVVSNAFVVDGRMMLSIVICMIWVIIICSFLPGNFKVKLVLPVTEPVVAHVPRFCLFNGDVVVGEGLGGSIVCFDRSGRLWMIN